jgi:hypothetical protein
MTCLIYMSQLILVFPGFGNWELMNHLCVAEEKKNVEEGRDCEAERGLAENDVWEYRCHGGRESLRIIEGDI